MAELKKRRKKKKSLKEEEKKKATELVCVALREGEKKTR